MEGRITIEKGLDKRLSFKAIALRAALMQSAKNLTFAIILITVYTV